MGILISTGAAFLGALLNYKTSLHMVGVAGVLCFILALSIYYNSNMLAVLALSFFITGAVASSRLSEKAHTLSEIFTGFSIGGLPQLMLLSFAL